MNGTANSRNLSIKGRERLEKLERAADSGALSLYVHIPFCVHKCLYCDFPSFAAGEALREQYVCALLGEIGENGRGQKVDTIFFGGGTPTVLDPAQLCRILDALRQRFAILPDAEITIECNPGTITREGLGGLRAAGFNRLSLGVQSLDDEELARLGRIHSAGDALRCFLEAREAGFRNISCDIMSALPGQTAEGFERTLRRMAELGPEHISAYSLIIEEGTAFHRIYRGDSPALSPALPDEETEREMYHRTQRVLAEYGYARYEISSYARPGRECAHNIGYWTGHQYLGMGLAAASLVRDGEGWRRFVNTRNIEWYLERYLHEECGVSPAQPVCSSAAKSGNEECGLPPAQPACSSAAQPGHVRGWADGLNQLREEDTFLMAKDRMEEFMFLGLRLAGGIREARFASLFGREFREVYGALAEKQEAQGLLCRRDGRIFLSDYGNDVSNRVMAEYLLD